MTPSNRLRSVETLFAAIHVTRLPLWRSAVGGLRARRLVIRVAPASLRHPPPLVAAYRFNEGGGDTLDRRFRTNNHGTPRQRTGLDRPRLARRRAEVRRQERSGLVKDASSLDLRTGMTIEAWVNPGGTDIAGPIAVKGRRERHEAAPLLHALHLADPSKSGLLMGVDHRTYSITGDTGFWTSGWRHIAGSTTARARVST